MAAIPAIEEVSRSDLALPRFFAVIFFSLAAFIGLPTAAAAIVYAISGNVRTFLFLASVTPIVWTLIWLGRLLWSGRSIPTWFIFAFCAVMEFVLVVTLFSMGEWIWALASLWMLAPLLLHFRSPRSGFPKKPLKSKEFDDFA